VEAIKEYGVKIKNVSCGSSHTTAVTEDGEVLVFGYGEYGLLGTGGTSEVFVPVSVESLVETNIVQVLSLSSCDTHLIYICLRNIHGSRCRLPPVKRIR
jgi:alpha-tubulin suppressor-like RCC1 family protein